MDDFGSVQAFWIVRNTNAVNPYRDVRGLVGPWMNTFDDWELRINEGGVNDREEIDRKVGITKRVARYYEAEPEAIKPKGWLIDYYRREVSGLCEDGRYPDGPKQRKWDMEIMRQQHANYWE